MSVVIGIILTIAVLFFVNPVFDNSLFYGLGLLINTFVLFIICIINKGNIKYENLNIKRGFLIGLCIGISAVPGVSLILMCMALLLIFDTDNEIAYRYSLIVNFFVLICMIINIYAGLNIKFVINIQNIICLIISFITGFFIIAIGLRVIKSKFKFLLPIYTLITGIALVLLN
jgi:undecaprenyl pyrophosphate phosphatase UppP